VVRRPRHEHHLAGDPQRRNPAPCLSDLTIATDGTVWFIETEADQVGRITPDGKIIELPLFGPADGYIRPSSIAAAPDGSVWVSATLARRLARVDGRTLTITQFPVSTGGGTVDAQSVAVDTAGGAWFERSAGSAMDTRPPKPALGRVDRTGTITYRPLPDDRPRWPGSLTAGPDDAIWFLDGPAKTVGRMAPDGTVTEFPFPYPALATGPTIGHLAAGSNALWLSQLDSKTLGVITCQGP
jgi:virginiamycin B lyase